MNKLVILSGNPNVGKTSIFNTLTGMHQHTGNWTGKTVAIQEGNYKNDKNIKLVDLPGTYSLTSMSDEESITRDSILFDDYQKNIIVIDSTLLERNLYLVLQILQVNKKVILVLNMDDLAKKEKIIIDSDKLSNILGVPVVKCSLKNKKSVFNILNYLEFKNDTFLNINYGSEVNSMIDNLENLIIKKLKIKNLNSRYIALKLLLGDKSIVSSIKKLYKVNILTDEVNVFLRDINFDNINKTVSSLINEMSRNICNNVVKVQKKNKVDKSIKFDRIITSKKYGIFFSFILLALIFYITIIFANYPSTLLNTMFNNITQWLLDIFDKFNVSEYIYKPLVLGVFKTLGWVISVMLPPMAIFFPLFSLGEECGLLPRIAFNFDKIFRKCGSQGKQALTMCMGFGCNACAIVGTRIIDSKKDKLISILTNVFVPCNGRFPLMISIISMFMVSGVSIIFQGFFATLILLLIIIFGVILSLVVSKFLSVTLLKGESSNFTLELPKYKKPKIFHVIIRSILDKVLFVLLRAVKVAAPAGLIIWLFANVNINDISILTYVSEFLEPFANLIGLDGIILLAFLLAFPANEIVLPIVLMGYMCTGSMFEIENVSTLKTLLVDNGWTLMTAISVCLFSLMHFPCATCVLTIKKEVGTKWAILSIIIPTVIGISILFLLNLFI